jgi:hypothetical protein
VTAVEIPKRMRKLERDRRGYPIPKSVFRDSNGKPHFQISDHVELRRLIKFDLCGMCGAKLKASRWFVGGPKSAFYVQGAYFDPPMHDECAHYALQVCPYLAAPTYSKRIEDMTIKDGSRTMVDERVEVERPLVFVAVEATGQTVRDRLIIPKQPYTKIEYWLHGTQMSHAEGEAMCKVEMK